MIELPIAWILATIGSAPTAETRVNCHLTN